MTKHFSLHKFSDNTHYRVACGLKVTRSQIITDEEPNCTECRKFYNWVINREMERSMTRNQAKMIRYNRAKARRKGPTGTG